MRHHRGGWLVAGVAIASAWAALLLTPAAATAQMQIWSGESKALTESELEEMAEILGLDEFQQESIAALYEGFLVDFERAEAEMDKIRQGAAEEFERSGEVGVWKVVGRKGQAYARYMDRIRDRLYEDIKLILTEEQVESWPRFERYQRRNRADDGDFGQVSGAWVDLVEIAQGLELTPEAEESVEPTLTAYEMELDAMLIDRQEALEEMSDSMLDEFSDMSSMDGFVKNMGTFQKIAKSNREMALKARDLQARWAPRIAAVLSEEDAAEFTRAFNLRAYPQVYKEGKAQDAFRECESYEELSEDDRARVAELKAAYEAEAASINAKWVKAIQRAEETKTGLFFWPGGSNELLDKAREAREDVDRRYVAQLAEFLPQELVEKLPDHQPKVDWRRLGDFDSWE